MIVASGRLIAFPSIPWRSPHVTHGGGGHPILSVAPWPVDDYCRPYSMADVDLSLFTLPRILG